MDPLQGNNLYRAIISKVTEIVAIDRKERALLYFERELHQILSLGSFTNAKSI